MDPAHGSMGLKYLSNAIANAPSKSRIRPRGKGVAKGGILGQHNACGHAHNKRLQLLDGDRSVDYIGRYFLTSLSFGASYDDIYRFVSLSFCPTIHTARDCHGFTELERA